MNKDDKDKPRPSLVPPKIIWAITEVREFGCKKYKDPDNWRTVKLEQYWDAYLRHTLKAWADPYAVDPESGLPHLWHAACNLSFIIEFMGDDWKGVALEEYICNTCEYEPQGSWDYPCSICKCNGGNEYKWIAKAED